LDSIQEWSDFMKTSSTWNYKSIVGKIMTGLALAIMIGSIEVMPAFGKDDHSREGHDNGRYEHRGRGDDRDRRAQGRRVYRPNGYGVGVYVPPPVIYAPPPPPGIGIFLPSIIIRP
jgi:hypothetical protein